VGPGEGTYAAVMSSVTTTASFVHTADASARQGPGAGRAVRREASPALGRSYPDVQDSFVRAIHAAGDRRRICAGSHVRVAEEDFARN